VEYNILAARAAAAALAFDQAATLLHTALELGIDDPRRRASVYLELGEAKPPRRQGRRRAGRVRQAADIARDLDDAQLLARAAIGFEDACWRPGMTDQGAVELLEDAAAALSDDESELRVGLLAGLARALDFQGDHTRDGRAHERHRDGAATRRSRVVWPPS
jgi:hypothetical protein